MDRNIIFLLGPGGVGKTTTGPLLAKRLGYSLIDVDNIYLEKYGNITKHVQELGYQLYTKNNTKLFEDLRMSGFENTVVVLSGGFIGYYDYDRLSQYGTTVVLLPHNDIEESVKIILERQSKRDFFIDMQNEEERSRKRIMLYQNIGDIKVYTYGMSPDEVAEKIYNLLS